jgi:hypothetical protein
VWQRGTAPGLDEPRRPRHEAAARLQGRRHQRGRPPFAITADDTRPLLRRDVSTRRSWHNSAGRASCLGQFRAPPSRAAPMLDDAGFRQQAIAQIRRPGRARAESSAACRAASIRGRRGADPRGDRRPAHCIFVDHGLLRDRRGGQVIAPLPRPLQHPAGPSRRSRTSSSAGSPA